MKTTTQSTTFLEAVLRGVDRVHDQKPEGDFLKAVVESLILSSKRTRLKGRAVLDDGETFWIRIQTIRNDLQGFDRLQTIPE